MASVPVRHSSLYTYSAALSVDSGRYSQMVIRDSLFLTNHTVLSISDNAHDNIHEKEIFTGEDLRNILRQSKSESLFELIDLSHVPSQSPYLIPRNSLLLIDLQYTLTQEDIFNIFDSNEFAVAKQSYFGGIITAKSGIDLNSTGVLTFSEDYYLSSENGSLSTLTLSKLNCPTIFGIDTKIDIGNVTTPQLISMYGNLTIHTGSLIVSEGSSTFQDIDIQGSIKIGESTIDIPQLEAAVTTLEASVESNTSNITAITTTYVQKNKWVSPWNQMTNDSTWIYDFINVGENDDDNWEHQDFFLEIYARSPTNSEIADSSEPIFRLKHSEDSLVGIFYDSNYNASTFTYRVRLKTGTSHILKAFMFDPFSSTFSNANESPPLLESVDITGNFVNLEEVWMQLVLRTY